MILVNVVYGIEVIRGHHFLFSWCIQTHSVQSKESTFSYRIFRFCTQLLICWLININDEFNELLLLFFRAHHPVFVKVFEFIKSMISSVRKKNVFCRVFCYSVPHCVSYPIWEWFFFVKVISSGLVKFWNH